MCLFLLFISHIHLWYILCVLVSFDVNLTQARVFWEEGISVEIVPLSD